MEGQREVFKPSNIEKIDNSHDFLKENSKYIRTKHLKILFI